VGIRKTFDLTVRGANHYITRTGLVNCQTIICFDELTQLEEEQYDQIITRLRTTDPVLAQMLKVRSMSNPMMRRGEVGDNFSVSNPHWVRDRFVAPAPEGKTTLKRKLEHPDGFSEYTTMLYLPATIDDNPDKAFVRQYRSQLLKAKPHIRQALLYGNWWVSPDAFYADEWNPEIHVRKPFTIPSDWRVFRAMDWGFKKPGCVLWFAMDHEDTLFVIRQMMFQGKVDVEVAKAIHIVEDGMGYWKDDRSALTGPADTQLWEERGDSGKTKAQAMAECGVPWTKAAKKSGSRQANAERITKRLKPEGEGATPNLVIFSTCRNLIQTLPAMQTDPDNTEQPLDGGDDHAHDALGYGVTYASYGPKGVAAVRKKKKDWADDDEETKKSAPRGRDGYGGS
jgi:phage terminase large subunit